MADDLRPFQIQSEAQKAVRFYGRERRKSLAGIPRMFRTHNLFGASMSVSTIDTDALFPDRSGPVTFRTAIRIDANPCAGLIFELGSSTSGCALALLNQYIGFAAGTHDGTHGGNALFNNGSPLPPGLELELVGALRPGSGEIRLWGNGRELARLTVSAGNFAGSWADSEDGSFADASSGTIPAALAAADFAPTNFTVIEPLSVYVGQVPRHFV
jgi:hypothetical protein